MQNRYFWIITKFKYLLLNSFHFEQGDIIRISKVCQKMVGLLSKVDQHGSLMVPQSSDYFLGYTLKNNIYVTGKVYNRDSLECLGILYIA